jgi:hypothetical protein
VSDRRYRQSRPDDTTNESPLQIAIACQTLDSQHRSNDIFLEEGFAYSHNGSLSNGNVVPDYANGAPLASGGNWYFSPNANPNNVVVNAPGQLTQDIDVSMGATGSLIPTGTAAYKISAFFNTYLSDNDIGHLHLNFLNASNVSIGTAEVTAPGNLQQWTQNSRGGLIPSGTTTVRVSIFGTGTNGGPDGYTDNVDFQVTNEVIQPVLTLTVNRDTGALALTNQTGNSVNLKSYSITSAFEGLEPANWVSITDSYDAGSPGPNQIDATHNWTELTDPTTNGDLSEADLQSGQGGSIGHTKSVSLGNANTWIKTPTEDLVFQYISGSEIKQGIVQFTGNGGMPFQVGDIFNPGDGINPGDWMVVRTNQHTNLSGQSLAEAYRLGDFNGDHLNNHADFVIFKAAYDAANGAGSFVAMLASIPEPATTVLVLTAGLLAIPARRRFTSDWLS